MRGSLHHEYTDVDLDPYHKVWMEKASTNGGDTCKVRMSAPGGGHDYPEKSGLLSPIYYSASTSGYASSTDSVDYDR